MFWWIKYNCGCWWSEMIGLNKTWYYVKVICILILRNSSWPNAIILWNKSESTLAQVMDCCLMAPSHYLNQCWQKIPLRLKIMMINQWWVIHVCMMWQKYVHIPFLKALHSSRRELCFGINFNGKIPLQHLHTATVDQHKNDQWN